MAIMFNAQVACTIVCYSNPHTKNIISFIVIFLKNNYSSQSLTPTFDLNIFFKGKLDQKIKIKFRENGIKLETEKI